MLVQREEGQSAGSAHLSNELLNRLCHRPTEANCLLRPRVLHFMEKADSIFDVNIPAWKKMLEPPVDRAEEDKVFFSLSSSRSAAGMTEVPRPPLHTHSTALLSLCSHSLSTVNFPRPP